MATTATAIPITQTNIGGELVADDESDSLNGNLDGFDPLWVSSRDQEFELFCMTNLRILLFGVFRKRLMQYGRVTS